MILSMILITSCQTIPVESPIEYPDMSIDYPARPVLISIPTISVDTPEVLPVINAYNTNMNLLTGYIVRLENYANGLLIHIEIIKGKEPTTADPP